LTSIIGDEMVMMNINGGNYIGLNKETRVIWEQKDQPILVKKLVKKLTTRFDVPYNTYIIDAIKFLQDMHLQHIVIIC
jgi:hypothetical protein